MRKFGSTPMLAGNLNDPELESGVAHSKHTYKLKRRATKKGDYHVVTIDSQHRLTL
jgi:hypothetical protein